METSPFSCPIFLGHPDARGRCSQSERVLYGRDLCCSGGTGKAEPAKLPGAGIWPEAVPKKMDSRKMEGCLSNSERIVLRANYDSRAKAKTVPKSPGLSRAQLEGATKTERREIRSSRSDR